LISDIVNSIEMPVILDASGLASFAGRYKDLQKASAKLILTPHIGEFSKLINRPAPFIMENSQSIAKEFAMKNNAILVLKKHNTAVSDGANLYINQSGTPAMASAGSGDVLSGIIGALSAIDKDLFEAASFAVFIHGLAGEIAEEEKGNGLTATDLIENIPSAFAKLKALC
ncbi:MAG: NAD(P)H-hydrate dehydratase, partial [Elusimicrobiota bacterium]|nr:NAD(P)H-hydrate dehydratase [Elusimicrobiota bacterium]